MNPDWIMRWQDNAELSGWLYMWKSEAGAEALGVVLVRNEKVSSRFAWVATMPLGMVARCQ